MELDAEPVFVQMTGQELRQRMVENHATRGKLKAKAADHHFVGQLARSPGFLQKKIKDEVKIQRGHTACGDPAAASGSATAPMEDDWKGEFTDSDLPMDGTGDGIILISNDE